ncbi:hypothetical protein BHM03_00034402 [Ensete ventricosum]|nr:hypothetical protein BHM03_00034402 [Ensete ventricosum]
MSRDEWSCGAQASAVDPCTIVHLRRELRSSLNSAECIGERSRVVADHYRSNCRRRKGSVGRDGVRRIEAADSRRSRPPASLNASFNSTRPCKKLPSVSCGLRFFSRNRICFPLSIIERVALWDVWQCNLAMKSIPVAFRKLVRPDVTCSYDTSSVMVFMGDLVQRSCLHTGHDDKIF